jgi:hypothetical protein
MNDDVIRERVDITWLLQHRLEFDDKAGRHFARNHNADGPQTIENSEALRRLGHVILCGALHVAYSTSDGVEGSYMMCALYRKSLLLANLDKVPGSYRVTAMLSLVNAIIDSTENGRGT